MIQSTLSQHPNTQFHHVSESSNLTQTNTRMFRTTVDNFLSSQQIKDQQTYIALCQHLCDSKLLRPQQAKHLSQHHSSISFPISLKQFQLIIMNNFADKNSLKLLNDLLQMQRALRDTKGILNVWREKGLTQTQAKQLQTIFAKGNDKMKQVFSHLSKSKETIDQISQQQLQIVSSMNEWVEMQNIKRQFQGYQQYIKSNKKSLEAVFNEIRVRQVHFRTKKQQPKSDQDLKMIKMVGFNSKNDEAVEVTKIPKHSLDFESIDRALTTFNAQHSLLFSEYFPRYLGYNTHADPTYFYYFRENFEGCSLKGTLEKTSITLDENTPIFKYWVTCLFLGLKDLYQMCDYEAELPIKLQDIKVTHSGLKIMFVDVSFCKLRNASDTSFYQARLLANLGRLIIDLLDIRESEINSKITKIQNKCLLNALIHAQKMFRNFEQGRIDKIITFFNAQTHPLFESKKELNYKVIMENFQALLSYKK